jgi:hypothetical protein
VTRAQANVIRAFSIWTVYVWVTRIWNIWGDEGRDGAFKAVHTVICVISIGFAIAAWIVVSQVRRRTLAAALDRHGRPEAAPTIKSAVAVRLDRASSGSSRGRQSGPA